MTYLLCPLRPGDENEELRYALRSWEANLVMPDLRLVTVGYRPIWLKPDDHIVGNRFKSQPLSIFDNIRLGSETLAPFSGDYLLMNDDFFCMYPQDNVLPVHRKMTLAEHVAMAGPSSSSAPFPASLRLTDEWLWKQGYPPSWSWEVHSPLPVQAQGMVSAIAQWKADNLGQFERVPQARTLYAVMNDVKGYAVEDCKLGINSTGIGTPWVSTSDHSWRRFGTSIKKRFQKPSRWE